MEGLFAILVWDRKVFFFLLVQIQNYLYEAATKLCFWLVLAETKVIQQNVSVMQSMVYAIQ